MTKNKTTENELSVEEFLNAIEDERKRKDSFAIVELIKEVTGTEPKMWGTSIVGFGSQHYKYDSGREGDWMVVGFSPRKANLTLYNLLNGNEELIPQLGKCTTGKGCLYIKRLDDIDLPTLKRMVEETVKNKMQQ